jgi:hypothetical protein
MRTQSVTQRFEFIRYSLGSITFWVCYFRAVRYFFCLRSARVEKTYFAVVIPGCTMFFCLPRMFFSMDTNRLRSPAIKLLTNCPNNVLVYC